MSEKSKETVTLMAGGDIETAIRTEETALQLDPNNESIKATLRKLHSAPRK